MAPTTSQIEIKPGPRTNNRSAPPQAQFRVTFIESGFGITSLFQQVLERLREPKITVPQKYYRGEATLPVTEMRPWYRDLPNQLRSLFEKPKPPVVPITSRPAEVPNIWQDYELQPGSWVNSMLVHALILTALVLPYIIKHLFQPAQAAKKFDVVDIAPYIPDLAGPAKRMGGGGGGGDRSPTPASKGALPKFAKEQFTPPMAKLPNLTPKLPMTPTLLGPPDLKLPAMASNMPWGDPNGVAGPSSNGPGTGGGIGPGNGTGIGSGNGAGFGPGDKAGYGGGPYSVGGEVSAPIPIYKPEPPYSEEARKAKYQGEVILQIVVDTNGNVTDARVVKALGLGLDEKALETVRTWKFKPGLRNGTPVPVRVLVEVTFRLF